MGQACREVTNTAGQISIPGTCTNTFRICPNCSGTARCAPQLLGDCRGWRATPQAREDLQPSSQQSISGRQGPARSLQAGRRPGAWHNRDPGGRQAPQDTA